MSATDSITIKELIYEYFELAKTKEIEKIEQFLDSRFTKFGDSPPYDIRDHDRALMLEQLQFASISDYDFKIEDLNIEISKAESAIATLVLQSSGMIVDDYSFRGTTINNKSRVTMVLSKDEKKNWKILHMHVSKFSA